MKIDKEIPIPFRDGKGKNAKYPWDALSVGDSFLATVKNVNSITLCRRNAERRYGIKCIARTTADGVRVWRIA